MSAKKSQRFSISGRNLQFLQNLAEQMDEIDITAALSYLLTDVRCLGYAIGQKPQPQPQPQRSPLGYNFEPAFEAIAPIQEQTQNYSEDPIIARFASLIEEF